MRREGQCLLFEDKLRPMKRGWERLNICRMTEVATRTNLETINDDSWETDDLLEDIRC